MHFCRVPKPEEEERLRGTEKDNKTRGVTLGVFGFDRDPTHLPASHGVRDKMTENLTGRGRKPKLNSTKP